MPLLATHRNCVRIAIATINFKYLLIFIVTNDTIPLGHRSSDYFFKKLPGIMINKACKILTLVLLFVFLFSEGVLANAGMSTGGKSAFSKWMKISKKDSMNMTKKMKRMGTMRIGMKSMSKDMGGIFGGMDDVDNMGFLDSMGTISMQGLKMKAMNRMKKKEMGSAMPKKMATKMKKRMRKKMGEGMNTKPDMDTGAKEEEMGQEEADQEMPKEEEGGNEGM